MTHIVAEPCFKCKYTDCVTVCPVECFYEGEDILVIHPDECIDCEACVPECPVEAIFHEDKPARRVGLATKSSTQKWHRNGRSLLSRRLRWQKKKASAPTRHKHQPSESLEIVNARLAGVFLLAMTIAIQEF